MSTLKHQIITEFTKDQIKRGILTLRLDEETQKRLSKIINITRRSKSDLVREAIFDFICSKYRDIL
jgi:predicted transcriptional regulator